MSAPTATTATTTVQPTEVAGRSSATEEELLDLIGPLVELLLTWTVRPARGLV